MRVTSITLINCVLVLLVVIAVGSTRADAGAGALCPPPGTCAKAISLCERGDEVPWCDIMFKCLACQE